jgi:hypothetical protein
LTVLPPQAALSRKRVLGVVALTVAIAAPAWLFLVHPSLQRARQVRALTDLELTGSALHSFRESHGKFPSHLNALPNGAAGLFDRWGHRYLYLSDGSMFLLASLGADGRPDGSNYFDMRARGEKRPCAGVNSDQVISDLGWHRRCGK